MFVYNNEHYVNNKQHVQLLDVYKSKMFTYIQRLFPELENSQVDQILDNIIQERLTVPKADIIYHDTNKEDYIKKEVDLLQLTDRTREKLIMSPSGTTFKRDTKDVFISSYITENQQNRKVIKKEMIRAEAIGDEDKASFLNNEQMGIKININAITGILNSNVFFKSRWNYNAITSTARFGIMIGYGLIERFLQGNLYLTSINKVIHYINHLLEFYPGDNIIRTILRRYDNFYEPSKEDIYDYLINKNMKLYSIIVSKQDDILIKDFIDSLTSYERFFIFYACSLWNVVNYNTDIFKEIFNDIFITKSNIIRKYRNMKKEEIEVSQNLLNMKDEALLTLVTIICYKIIPKKMQLRDAIEDNRIHAILIDMYNYLRSHIKKHFEIFFKYFFNINITVIDPYNHKNMLRKCTLISDTDSIIFTVEPFIKKLNKKTTVNSKTMSLGNIIIYLAQKHLDHMFKYVSSELNVTSEFLHRIKFKNEFYYPSMIRSIIKKHYLGLIIIREGTMLDPPKLDIKGQLFKKSNLPKSVKQELEKFATSVLQKSMKSEKISIFETLDYILNIEHKIIKSVNSNSDEYLLSVPIRPKEAYKEPMKSVYFNYLFYNEVLSWMYPNITINLPQKFRKLPLSKTISIKKLSSIEPIKKNNKQLYEKLVKFLEKYPKKNINFLYIPNEITTIPKEFKYLIDYSKIVYSNCFSFYVLLMSLGYTFPLEKQNIKILSDIFNIKKEEI